MDNNFIKTKENSYDLSGKEYGINDVKIPANGNNENLTFSKPFKSRYISEAGKWSRQAVDEGMVDFDDYIKDIETEPDDVPNFNNKVLTVNSSKNDNGYNIQNSEEKKDLLNDYSLANTNPTLTASFPSFVGSIGEKIQVADYWAEKGKWTAENLGISAAVKAGNHSNDSGVEAAEKAEQWNLDSTWNNKADAYRHFIWNAKMTRDSDIGYYNARNITNRYEYENMQDNNWLSSNSNGFDYQKDNTIIKGRMNQEMFMDLWNNQVGRELANNKEFKSLDTDELFDFADKYGLLITDANKTYDFLGITDYIVDPQNHTVDVEWNLTTGNIKVMKGRKSVTLKIGV
ncbi:MAG: hypothetical protein IJ300_03575 [Clostridia bacterium]|nr:hypothetical protein [Clostridia bacterium]